MSKNGAFCTRFTVWAGGLFERLVFLLDGVASEAGSMLPMLLILDDSGNYLLMRRADFEEWYGPIEQDSPLDDPDPMGAVTGYAKEVGS